MGRWRPWRFNRATPSTFPSRNRGKNEGICSESVLEYDELGSLLHRFQRGTWVNAVVLNLNCQSGKLVEMIRDLNSIMIYDQKGG